MRLFRIVMNADHTTSPIRPMTCARGSSIERDGISRRSGSLHSTWAPTKSIPCFLRLAADFAGSNSKSIWYKKYPRTGLGGNAGARFLPVAFIQRRRCDAPVRDALR